jgi:hypothetical protein
MGLNVKKKLLRDVYQHTGDRGGTVVKVLCYKSEGRWFDSLEFFIDIIFQIALCHWGRLSLYHK